MNGPAIPRQLLLDLPHRTALGRDDFLVTASNRAAVAMIDAFPDWPHHALALVGPPGSGKSHLLEVWRQLSGARLCQAVEITVHSAADHLASGAVAVDDASAETSEQALFHLLNVAKQSGGFVLLASASPPSAWGVSLPDLATRLNAIPVATIGLPDDDLLRGVLVKLFADRQLAVGEAVVSYLVRRMPRSLDAARGLVAEIDRQALEHKTEVSRGFVARVLQDFIAPELFGED